MTDQATIDAFLAQNTLAVAGVSRSGKGFGNAVVRDLTAKDYRILAVHPEADRFAGVEAYGSLADLPDGVGGLILVVPPSQTEKLVREAREAGITRIWMQQGAESQAAIDFCRKHGLDLVHGECIMMFAHPTGIHRFHRWINGLLGKLPTTDAPEVTRD